MQLMARINANRQDLLVANPETLARLRLNNEVLDHFVAKITSHMNTYSTHINSR
jgi:hypothetical protein